MINCLCVIFVWHQLHWIAIIYMIVYAWYSSSIYYHILAGVSIVAVITIPIVIVIITIAIIISVFVIIGAVKKIRRVRLDNGGIWHLAIKIMLRINSSLAWLIFFLIVQFVKTIWIEIQHMNKVVSYFYYDYTIYFSNCIPCFHSFSNDTENGIIRESSLCQYQKWTWTQLNH